MKQYDAAVIGFGKGGKTLASALAGAGKKTVMIEQSDKMYGGTCINVGCIPSKSLVASAEMSDALGGSFEEKAARYSKAIQEKNRVTTLLRKKNFDKLDGSPHVDILTGKASFSGPKRITVTAAGKSEELESQMIFINTGAAPFVPPIPGLAESRRMYVSETLMDLDTLPQKLVIIGGGYIGMEFSSIYTGFGSQVTVIQDGPVFLPREDEDIAQAVMKDLNERGIRIMLSAEIESVRDEAERTAVTVRTGTATEVLEADAVLVATGRRPYTEGLNAAAAGVELTERGTVKTDKFLRTTAPDIWAMGDVAGGLQFTYISLDDYRIVKSQILGGEQRSTENRGAVPYSVFFSPPFSRVGLSEKEAREQGFQVQTARLSVAAIPRAQLLRRQAGHLKVVIDAQSKRDLGAHLFCPESHEIINIFKVAIDAGIPYPVLGDGIYSHPTMAEALNELFASVG